MRPISASHPSSHKSDLSIFIFSIDGYSWHFEQRTAAWLPIIWWCHQMETFSALLALCEGIHRSPVDSPHKGQWSGVLMFYLIWTNSWPNDRDTGDLRRHRAYYDVTVMWETSHYFNRQIAFCQISTIANRVNPDSKVHVNYMGPTWVLPAPVGTHVGPMNLAIREVMSPVTQQTTVVHKAYQSSCRPTEPLYWRAVGYNLSVSPWHDISFSHHAELW